MTPNERIKQLCKEKGIAVSKLEKDLGFANAYILQMNPETVQHGRIQKIADYFGVTVDYLMTGETPEGYHFDKATAEAAQEIYENKELRLLFEVARTADPEDLRAIHDMLLALKRKEERYGDIPPD